MRSTPVKSGARATDSASCKLDSTRPGATTHRALTTMFCALLLAAVPSAYGQTETVLYSFAGSPDGAYPYAVTPVLDPNGHVYGTTEYGGFYSEYGYGTVFEVTPSGTERILHSFDSNGADGYNPVAGLLRDTNGNLYGTTYYGGAYGYGTVFELTPSGTETILYSFGGTVADGRYPHSALIQDTKGNLYGTTVVAGDGCGSVYKLTPSGTETILYTFTVSGTGGCYPYSGLVQDAKGNLYGTAYNGSGGNYGFGTVFELAPSGTITVLHVFAQNGTDGINPYGGIMLDAKGNIYGTTVQGGTYGWGTVFKLTPSGTETIIHSFQIGGTDGYSPHGGLVRDGNGNLYGTTFLGGEYGWGTVFKVTPSGTETILHSFTGADGGLPVSSLASDASGSLYGTGSCCGAHARGAVYKLVP